MCDLTCKFLCMKHRALAVSETLIIFDVWSLAHKSLVTTPLSSSLALRPIFVASNAICLPGGPQICISRPLFCALEHII